MIRVVCAHPECVWSLVVDEHDSERTRAAHCWSTHRCVGDCRAPQRTRELV